MKHAHIFDKLIYTVFLFIQKHMKGNIAKMILMVVLKYHALVVIDVLMYQHLELVSLAHLVLVDTLEMELFVITVRQFLYLYTQCLDHYYNCYKLVLCIDLYSSILMQNTLNVIMYN